MLSPNMIKNRYRTLVLFFTLTLISFGSIGGCGGENPPFAPFGSDIEILTDDFDLAIGSESIVVTTFEAIVTGPDGQPLNGVRVRWDLTFAGLNDIVIDTDGDGISDQRGLQLIDPDACGNINCQLVPIPVIFANGGFVDSFFETLTDDRGLTTIAVLISGQTSVTAATLTASTLSGAIDSVDLDIETGGGG